MTAYAVDDERASRPHVVYRFYDLDGALLYVGVTDNPRVRWGHHRRTKAWWPEVEVATVQSVANRGEALAVERLAIIDERPRYNVTHAADPNVLRLFPLSTVVTVDPSRLLDDEARPIHHVGGPTR